MSISYEEVRKLIGRDPDVGQPYSLPDRDWHKWRFGSTYLLLTLKGEQTSWELYASQWDSKLISGTTATPLLHLLAGLGVREWEGEASNDSVSALLIRLHELCAAISGDSQEEAILRIDDEGTWSAECHCIDGRGPTPEEACLDAIREASASLSARAYQLEQRATMLRQIAEVER